MLDICSLIVAADFPVFIAVFPYLIMILAKVVRNIIMSFMKVSDLAAVSSVIIAP